ncbi:MAG: GerMN domain-containing protein [Clostridiales bacterium]|jgi:hypothetical protein|nr:GerMN domain-containing protein [Clostridiales bacterium]
MKKFVKVHLMPLVLALALSLTVFSGCNSDNADPIPTETASESPEPAEPDTTVYGKATDYFPFDSNLKYTYKRSDEFKTSVTYPVYQTENRLQRMTTAGTLTTTDVIEKTEDAVIVAFAHSESSGFEYFADRTDPYSMVLLKDPIQLGNSWETQSGPSLTGIANGKSEITGVNVALETPAGTFNAIEISTEMDNGFTIVDYYVKDIGLVREDSFAKGISSGGITSEDREVALELESIEENSSTSAVVNVYYPQGGDSVSLDSESRTVDFRTNDNMIKILEEVLKKPSENAQYGLIPESASILNLNITREEIVQETTDKTVTSEIATVNIDLTKGYLTEQESRQTKEALLVFDGLRQTLMNFYVGDTINLTVEGQPYTMTAQLNVFYPNDNASALSSELKEVTFNPNVDSVVGIFEELLKHPTENPEIQLIPDGAHIMGVSMDDNNTTLTVDLSSEFVTEKNSGLAYEELIMEAIKQTFLNFYNSKEFVLTVEGEAYTPQH